MKIIHTGDVHIGSAFKNLPMEKATLRKTEILQGFRRICAYAKSEKIGAVLIAGDLFDGNVVSADEVKGTLSSIAAAAPVLFFYVSGNHDGEFFFSDVLPENLYTFSSARGFRFFDLPENITVAGMDAKYFSPETFSALSLERRKFNIVLLHGDTQTDIPLAYLQNKNVDYLALGHIHKPDKEAKKLDSRGYYRYCGCPEGRGFDETGARGFFLLDIRNGRIEEEKFLSFVQRQTVEVRVDISSCGTYFDLEDAVDSALRTVRKEDSVKLVLCGSFRAGLQKNLPLLYSRLSQRYFSVKTEDVSRLFIDYNEYKNDLTERGEFVREVGRYEMSEEFRAEVLEVGLKALAGEEIDL